MGKESTEQAQILETVGKKDEIMKQEIRKTSQKGNPNDTDEHENIEEKKAATDVKEQSTEDQQLPKVTITKQNDTNITTAPKEIATTRTQISERRLDATKQGQLKNNKYKNQKVLEQEGEDKDSCPKCKKYVSEGVKCGVCDKWIH